jgi:hypothetical protein
MEQAPVRQDNRADLIVRQKEIEDLSFYDGKILLLFDSGTHRQAIEFTVRLGAGAADCRALPAIEHSKLDAGLVRDPAHQAIQGIDFTDQMAFSKTSYRRIA